jgi:hypothetical protein
MDVSRIKDCEQAIGQGLGFLRNAQLPTGEFRTLVARDENLTVEAQIDPSCFATAHIVSSLTSLRRHACQPLIARAANFLMAERQAGALWKFWASRHPGFANIPPDLDDTAVVSLALQDAGIPIPRNRPILCANRNGSGLFYTWILRRPRHLCSLQCWWAILRGQIGVAQTAFFSTGQACPDDVDAVVNANAIRLLWKDSSLVSPSVTWLRKVLEVGEAEKADRSYQSSHALSYAIARGAQAGIPSFLEMGGLVTRSVLSDVDDLTAQKSALSLLALSVWQPEHPLLASMADFLVSRQQEDGSWPGEAYFYGGWKRVLHWGSPELTTAFCIEALARYTGLRQ